MAQTILLLHALATVMMTGLIWFVQLVHYPLFAHVGADRFIEYERGHTRRTTWIVAPLMLIELAAAVALVIPSGLSRGVEPGWAWAGLALVAVNWFSTTFVQVPLHRRLERRFDTDDARRLVQTNWIRTVVWSARAAIALLLLIQHDAASLTVGRLY